MLLLALQRLVTADDIVPETKASLTVEYSEKSSENFGGGRRHFLSPGVTLKETY